MLNKVKNDVDFDCSKYSIEFKGWPQLEIHAIGEGFDQSLNIPFMEAFCELQKAIYRSYSIVRYDNKAARLTQSEKDMLAITVFVRPGSSELIAELTNFVQAITDVAEGNRYGWQ